MHSAYTLVTLCDHDAATAPTPCMVAVVPSRGLPAAPGNRRRRGDLAPSVVCSSRFFVLRFDHPDWVAMQTRQAGLEGTGEVKLRHLVKEALRMRPSRI